MFILFCIIFIFSFVFVGAFQHVLSGRHFAKTSRAQSMKDDLVTSGGGFPILLTVFPLWYYGFGQEGTKDLVFILAIMGIAVVSWFDDWFEISAGFRLAVHALLVSLCLVVFPSDWHILPGYVPITVERILLGICWIWFINLFNFMDGIDGLAGAQSVFITMGIIIVGFYFPISNEVISLSTVLCAGVFGFLIWNWYPSKIILGDIGSVSLGFTLGWLLIHVAYQGHLFAALVLPSYFVADATITLIKRMLKGERFWKPHREHFYQRVVLSGFKPSLVVSLVAVVNLMQLIIVIFSYSNVLVSLFLSVLVLSGLLFFMHHLSTN